MEQQTQQQLQKTSRRRLGARIVYVVVLAIFVASAALFFVFWQKASSAPIRIGYPVAGDNIQATDYSSEDNWLAVAESPDKPVDVFFVYPTSWRAKPGEFPISEINNPEMRHWAKYYLDTRASAFSTAGNIYAPFYRQLDAAFALNQESILATEYMEGVPYTDVKAAFEYYIEHFNGGRPFILVSHSQGSAMTLLLLMDYMNEHPDVYARMGASYSIGIPITQSIYDACPWLKAAQRADDTGVIISYNTQAPVVDAPGNPLANAQAVLINPVSWQPDNQKTPPEQSQGSVGVDQDTGAMTDLGSIASAQIDATRGVIITDVDRERFSSDAQSRAYFPLGMFHENDIPLFYYDLRANAELRVQTFLGSGD
jgi:hypothetical protein